MRTAVAHYLPTEAGDIISADFREADRCYVGNVRARSGAVVAQQTGCHGSP